MLALVRIVLLALYCIIASVISLVICVLRPFNPSNSGLCARIYGVPLMYLLGIKVEGDNLLSAPRPCVFMGNHQSNFDLFILGSQVPKRTVSVGKKSLKWIPLFGQVYWLAGNMLIERGNAQEARAAMTKSTQILTEKDTSLWIFPEGTRNASGTLLPFKKGAVQMAVSAQVPIVPVCVNNYIGKMNLNRWHSVTVRIKVLEAIPTQGLGIRDIKPLTQRCQAVMGEAIHTLDQQDDHLAS